MEAKQKKRVTTKVGTVVAKKSAKTVKVLVKTLEKHPLYKKTIRTKKVFLAHDELDRCQVGDVVRIAESRPISKLKRWWVAEIVDLASKDIESEIKDELT